MCRSAIIAFVAALGALPGCMQRGPRPDDRPLVAKIGEMPIYVDEFKRELKRIKLEDVDGLPAASNEPAQKRALLDNLIDRRLILQQAEHANVIVGSDEVEAAYARTRAGWDEAEFNNELSQKDMTQSELKAELREELLIRKYFRDHVFSRVAVTDDEIEGYIKTHPELLIVPEQVHARHLVVKTEEEAQSVLLEIKKGLRFEDAAMKHSLSPDGKNGGDLGWFARGVMPHVFDDVCFALGANEMSKVTPGDFGFYIFKVIEKRAMQARTAEAVRDQVEAVLLREKERAAEEAKIAELHKAVRIEIEEEQLARVH